MLKSCRMPQNAGNARWPMANIMLARNPTVRAWREAPQIPPFESACAAHNDPRPPRRLHTRPIAAPECRRPFVEERCRVSRRLFEGSFANFASASLAVSSRPVWLLTALCAAPLPGPPPSKSGRIPVPFLWIRRISLFKSGQRVKSARSPGVGVGIADTTGYAAS